MNGRQSAKPDELFPKKLKTMPRREAIALVGGSAFIFGCSLLGASVTFVNQILLARWMGARELRIYVFALSLYSLICVLVGLGYPTAAYRFIGLGRLKGETFEWIQ